MKKPCKEIKFVMKWERLKDNEKDINLADLGNRLVRLHSVTTRLVISLRVVVQRILKKVR